MEFVKMRSYCSKMVPQTTMTGVFIRRKNLDEHTPAAKTSCQNWSNASISQELVEVRRGSETDSSLVPSERAQSFQHLDLRRSRTVREIYVVKLFGFVVLFLRVREKEFMWKLGQREKVWENLRKASHPEWIPRHGSTSRSWPELDSKVGCSTVWATKFPKPFSFKLFCSSPSKLIYDL